MLTLVLVVPAASADTIPVKEVFSKNLKVSDISCRFERRDDPSNPGAIGTMWVEMMVKGSKKVAEVMIASWSDSVPEKSRIQEEMEMYPEIWKRSITSFDGKIPFQSGNGFPIRQDNLGTDLYLVMLGMDKNVNAVGYVVLQISVPDDEAKVTSIKLNKSKATLEKGKTLKLKIKSVKPADAKVKEIVWSSSNKKIATVDQNGKVKAKKKGTCVITCTADGVEATCTIKVK